MNDWISDAKALIQAPATDSASEFMNRRHVLKGGLGVGYAMAAMPILAQNAINTDHQGLDAREVMVTVGQDSVPAYVAKPQAVKNPPVVLLISEIFGVHQYIADTARRLAKQGYYAIAPDLFMRQGDPAMYAEVAKLVAEVVSKVPDEQVMLDLDACVAFAKSDGGNAERLAITGFCWGGRITWMYAAHQPQLKAGVAWYGRLVGKPSPTSPKNPLDLVEQLKAPVLGLYGGKDTGIPLSSVKAMQEALAKLSGPAAKSEFVIYPEAPHAFHADYRPSFQAQAAQDGWARLLAWFKQHGV